MRSIRQVALLESSQTPTETGNKSTDWGILSEIMNVTETDDGHLKLPKQRD
ncbi:Hypothetical protein FKW44_002403 [Caligus rogercresseyi]|uniref:Uncharacterized protein n=1 Tax=Caligus rogercresseyi TaxID=217165 RepID=A0A7T8KK66_CALRO|nr:Hypothetical protein FKW44_002403 [Caligus rogercresseyi]